MRPLSFLAFAFLACAPLACGGATASLETTSGDDGGSPSSPSSPASPSSVPDHHRTTAAACIAHGSAGVPCTDDTQCAQVTPGAAISYCFQGICGPDTCLSDSDCASGDACACAGSLDPQGSGSTGSGGYPGAGYIAGNACVPAQCRVDADCGAGGYCSPSADFTCGNLSGVVGFYCHRPGDACQRNADCASPGNAGPLNCAYDPDVGHWACGTAACAG
jgi:Cys-rich repeat protein